MLQLARNQPAKALAHLQKAVGWDPFSPPFRCMSAMALDQMGRTTEALEALAEAEKLAPNDPQIQCMRATLLVHSGRTQEARAAVSRALEIRPDFAPAAELLKQLDANPP